MARENCKALMIEDLFDLASRPHMSTDHIAAFQKSIEVFEEWHDVLRDILKLAITSRNKTAMELLSQNEMVLFELDEHQRTPFLYYMAECASDEVDFELLYPGDEEINRQDDQGNTALHYACMQGDEGMINWILNQDANSDIKNDEGLYPIDILHKKVKDFDERLQISGHTPHDNHAGGGGDGSGAVAPGTLFAAKPKAIAIAKAINRRDTRDLWVCKERHGETLDIADIPLSSTTFDIMQEIKVIRVFFRAIPAKEIFALREAGNTEQAASYEQYNKILPALDYIAGEIKYDRKNTAEGRRAELAMPVETQSEILNKQLVLLATLDPLDNIAITKHFPLNGRAILTTWMEGVLAKLTLEHLTSAATKTY